MILLAIALPTSASCLVPESGEETIAYFTSDNVPVLRNHRRDELPTSLRTHSPDGYRKPVFAEAAEPFVRIAMPSTGYSSASSSPIRFKINPC